MASTPPAASTSQAPPSQDAFASIITQVSPTGQPARAPTRPVRPRGQSQKKVVIPGQGTRKTSASKPKVDATASSANAASTATSPQAATRQLVDGERNDPTPSTDETAVNASNAGLTASEPTNTSQPLNASAASTAGSSKDSSLQKPLPTTSTAPGQQQQGQTSRSVQSTANQQQGSSTSQKKKKRKGFLASVFSCFSGSAHDDDDAPSKTMSERKPGTANATRAGQTGDSSKAAAGPSTGPTGAADVKGNKDVALVSLAKGDNKDDSSSKLGPGQESTTGTSATSTLNAPPQEASSFPANTAVTAGTAALVGVGATGLGLGAAELGAQRSLDPADPASHDRSNIAPEVLAANQPGGTPLSRDETGDLLSGAVQAPGSEGLTPKKEKRRKSSSGERSSMALTQDGDISRASSVGASGATAPHHGADSVAEEEVIEDSEADEEEEEEEEFLDEEERIIAQGGMGIPVDENGNPRPLLRELSPSDSGRKCLVLDLDETLVHSSFKLIHSPDFIVPVEIENQVHNVYVIKRPGVDAFMKRMGELYEVVVFTASLSKYADPVLDHLDIHRVVKHRLFRESCYNHRGNYVKDLSQLGRPIGESIIIDNSPASYIFHPNNAVPVSSWFNDPHDTELTDLQGFLTDLATVPDVRGVLDGGLFPLS